MPLPKKRQIALGLTGFFSASFIIVFFTILLTQSAYSTPTSYAYEINRMDIAVGPVPNSTNIPLDTTITVEALASASLNDLHVIPEINFASITSETTGPLTYRTSFHPDQLLQPDTLYSVSVTIMDVPVSWAFTTTTEPFHPGIGYYLVTNELWIALSVAASATAVAGLALWFKKN